MCRWFNVVPPLNPDINVWILHVLDSLLSLFKTSGTLSSLKEFQLWRLACLVVLLFVHTMEHLFVHQVCPSVPENEEGMGEEERGLGKSTYLSWKTSGLFVTHPWMILWKGNRSLAFGSTSEGSFLCFVYRVENWVFFHKYSQKFQIKYRSFSKQCGWKYSNLKNDFLDLSTGCKYTQLSQTVLETGVVCSMWINSFLVLSEMHFWTKKDLREIVIFVI